MHLFRTSATVLVLLTASIAGADTPSTTPAAPNAKAAPYLEKGLRLYATQKYADAITELEAGYQIDPHPDFLYAIGQAKRLGGDCKGATEAYHAYLRTQPPDAEAGRAREQIQRCEAQLAPPPPVVHHESFGLPGYAMLSGSVLAFGLGGFALVTGKHHADQAERARSLGERTTEEHAARNYRIVGGVSIAGGIALGALTVLRFLSTRDSAPPKQETKQLTATVGADEFTIGAAFSF